MRATLEASTDGILAVDGAGRITHFNGNYLEMWRARGASAAEAASTSPIAGRHGEPAARPQAFVERHRRDLRSAPAETLDVLELPTAA